MAGFARMLAAEERAAASRIPPSERPNPFATAEERAEASGQPHPLAEAARIYGGAGAGAANSFANSKSKSSLTADERAKASRISPALLVDADTYQRCRHLFQSAVQPLSPPVVYSYEDEDPTNEHHQHYLKLVEESQGYYVPQVPAGVRLAAARLETVPADQFYMLERGARDALNWYNEEKKEDETYELVKVECGSHMSLGSSHVYFVAFIARGSVSDVEVPFRAKVHYGILGKYHVDSCEEVAESCAKFTRLNGRCC